MSDIKVTFTQAEFGFVKQSILDQAQALVDTMDFFASQEPEKDIDAVIAEANEWRSEFKKEYTTTIDSEFMNQLNKKPNKKAPYGYKADGTPKQKPGRKV